MDKTRLQHFRNLVSLSAADGKIAEEERVALSKIAFERGIPPERFNVMISHASEYQYLIPQNMDDRHTQLAEMIDLALVDGEFAKAEYELIMTVSDKLGFTRAETDDMIANRRAARK